VLDIESSDVDNVTSTVNGDTYTLTLGSMVTTITKVNRRLTITTATIATITTDINVDINTNTLTPSNINDGHSLQEHRDTDDDDHDGNDGNDANGSDDDNNNSSIMHQILSQRL
jgi:hypothetical protein